MHVMWLGGELLRYDVLYTKPTYFMVRKIIKSDAIFEFQFKIMKSDLKVTQCILVFELVIKSDVIPTSVRISN